MKAVALVVSARKHDNCYDFAEFMLKRLKKTDIEAELINFYDYQNTPCQTCNYECVQKFDPQKGVNTECSIKMMLNLFGKKPGMLKFYSYVFCNKSLKYHRFPQLKSDV